MTNRVIVIEKEDLINKLETLSGYLRHENKNKIDKKFYDQLCDEVEEFCESLRVNNVELHPFI